MSNTQKYIQAYNCTSNAKRRREAHKCVPAKKINAHRSIKKKKLSALSHPEHRWDSCTWAESVLKMRSSLLIKMHELSLCEMCEDGQPEHDTRAHIRHTQQLSGAAVMALRVVQPVNKCLVPPFPTRGWVYGSPSRDSLVPFLPCNQLGDRTP